jgi:hypothetical protein
VGRFRFLRSNQITKIVEGSSQGILRRLGKLFQAGYLSRLPQITIQISLPGYKGRIYSLGPGGRKYLASQGGLYSHRQQEKQPKIPYLAHTLKVADFFIDLENCLPPGVDLFHHDEFRALFSPKRGVAWKVPIRQGAQELEVGVIPD